MLKKCTENETKNIIVLLHKSAMCPHLNVAWSSWQTSSKNFIVELEKDREAANTIRYVEYVPDRWDCKEEDFMA